MHFNVLIKIKCPETLRPTCPLPPARLGTLQLLVFRCWPHVHTWALGTAAEGRGVDAETGGRRLGGGAVGPTLLQAPQHPPLTNAGIRPARRDGGHPGPSRPPWVGL